MLTPDAGLLQASVSSASSLMALQLITRIFTFCLNQAMFRLASPRAFGLAAVQFELLMSTILFLSREGVRNALLRAWPSRETQKRPKAIMVTNVALVPMFLGIPLAGITCGLYSSIATSEARDQPHFTASIIVYALAAVVELMNEPMHNRYVRMCFIHRTCADRS